MDAKELFSGMSDPVLLEATQAALEVIKDRNLTVPALAGSLALEGAQSETATTTPETTPEAPIISSEILLATLDTALKTYSSLLDVTNNERAKVQDDKKPEQLEAIDQAIIRAEVEALVSEPAILAELQNEADYFTANPETHSPAVGFDIIVIPEGLTATDEQAIAEDLQTKIITDYRSPRIRPEAYNDKRSPVITGKGYRIAFAPRHYNVPEGTTAWQRGWMGNENDHGLHTDATEMQTAADAEALAQIINLQATGELNDPNTRLDRSYFRRFDQAPFGDHVSSVYVYDYGRLYLAKSGVRNIGSSRALVVPKKLNA
jgi:hypothetical protein